MNPTEAVKHTLEAQDCRAVARMLSDMGMRRDALVFLKEADAHDEAARKALEDDHDKR
jgi:hypothetical protein